MEEQNNIIILEDEEGNEVKAEVIDVFDLNGSRYVAMIDAETPEDEEETDVIIMKILVNEEDPEKSELVDVENDDELQAAFEEFVKRDEEYSEEE